MTQREFDPYIPILQRRDFALFPTPTGMDNNRFSYADNDETHLKIKNLTTGKTYALPLVLVEFANDGVLRLSRAVEVWNGSSFV